MSSSAMVMKLLPLSFKPILLYRHCEAEARSLQPVFALPVGSLFTLSIRDSLGGAHPDRLKEEERPIGFTPGVVSSCACSDPVDRVPALGDPSSWHLHQGPDGRKGTRPQPSSGNSEAQAHPNNTPPQSHPTGSLLQMSRFCHSASFLQLLHP
jgi:hypothetical protein